MHTLGQDWRLSNNTQAELAMLNYGPSAKGRMPYVPPESRLKHGVHCATKRATSTSHAGSHAGEPCSNRTRTYEEQVVSGDFDTHIPSTIQDREEQL